MKLIYFALIMLFFPIVGIYAVTSQVIETGSFPGNRDHQFNNVISSSFLSQDFSH